MFLRKLNSWGDKFEDRVRARLSRWPIIYAFIGGLAIVVFWRGIWHTTDWIHNYLGVPAYLDGPLSVVAGTLILLATGLIVSSFIGERIIISGLKGERKVVDQTIEEMMEEEGLIKQIKNKVNKIEKEVDGLTNNKT